MPLNFSLFFAPSSLDEVRSNALEAGPLLSDHRLFRRAGGALERSTFLEFLHIGGVRYSSQVDLLALLSPPEPSFTRVARIFRI